MLKNIVFVMKISQKKPSGGLPYPTLPVVFLNKTPPKNHACLPRLNKQLLSWVTLPSFLKETLTNHSLAFMTQKRLEDH